MKELWQRAKEVVFKPKETWLVIKGEATTIQELFINYAAPLALIPAVASLIALALIGLRLPSGLYARAPFSEALVGSVLSYVFNLVGLMIGAWVINFLAPYFNAKSNLRAAVKVVLYSTTPIWLLGIFSILPGVAMLQIFGLYGLYLLYQGLLLVLETPPEKALWFTVVAVVAALFISIVTSVIIGGAVYGPMYMRMMAV
jgi:hypothetical protein